MTILSAGVAGILPLTPRSSGCRGGERRRGCGPPRPATSADGRGTRARHRAPAAAARVAGAPACPRLLLRHRGRQVAAPRRPARPASRYCHTTECQRTVVVPGRSSMLWTKSPAAIWCTVAGTRAARSSAPRSRSSRSSWSGQTYDVSRSRPSGVVGSSGAESQPARSTTSIRASSGGSGPRHGSVSTTDDVSGPTPDPSGNATRNWSARRLRPALAPISNSRRGRG